MFELVTTFNFTLHVIIFKRSFCNFFTSSKRRSVTDVSLVCRYVHRSSVFGKTLNRSRSCETLTLSISQKSIKRIVSATFDSEYTDEESDQFVREIHELEIRFQLSDDDNTDSPVSELEQRNSDQFGSEITNWFGDMIPVSIERRARYESYNGRNNWKKDSEKQGNSLTVR
ncbi:hypothetical protein L1987_63302 [Smallanthus sonchifolius]|uniref:Uncharacterized protein n=1 Tax=Smallanthus sonchifolius TaxID=185202 RepID=A0ACB9CCZ4_9ASTR|nr:hypothetical protein L1987_63302 [Smallanthus sonchifolius]